MISIEVFEMNHFFQILEERFYLKEVELQDLCNYFQEYSPKVTLAEVTEGYIQDAETIKMYIRNANSENNWLPDELKRYDLYILGFKDEKLVATFYREEFEGNSQLVDFIESFKKYDAI